MKRKLSYLFSVLAIAGMMLFPTVAIAHTENSSNSNSVKTTTSSSDDVNETTEIESENKDIDDRIAKFKEHFKVKLAAVAAARIKLKCVGAQKVVGTINTKFGNSITVRTNAYTQLQKNLDKLVDKLKAADIDTADLETHITELKSKIETYNTDLEAYKQALADLKAVDCQADADAFQAALLAARSARETLIEDVKDIRLYLVTEIKPALKDIRKEFASKKADDDSSTEDDDSSTDSEGGDQ